MCQNSAIKIAIQFLLSVLEYNPHSLIKKKIKHLPRLFRLSNYKARY